MRVGVVVRGEGGSVGAHARSVGARPIQGVLRAARHRTVRGWVALRRRTCVLARLCGRRRLHHALKQGSQWRKPPPSPPRPPRPSMGLDLGATLGDLLRGGARRFPALEGGGRVGPARLPPPGDGAASPTDGDGARAAEPEPTADPGGSWWPWGARHADEGDESDDDEQQLEHDELRRRIRMK